MRGSKIPMQKLWLKIGGGRIREGGVIAGFYGTHTHDGKNTHVYTYTHSHTLRYKYVHVHTHINTHKCTCIHTFIHR